MGRVLLCHCICNRKNKEDHEKHYFRLLDPVEVINNCIKDYNDACKVYNDIIASYKEWRWLR